MDEATEHGLSVQARSKDMGLSLLLTSIRTLQYAPTGLREAQVDRISA